VKGPAADATDALQPWGLLCNPVMKIMIIIFCPSPSNGAPVEWNWQGKTEELGEKPASVPLCQPQIPHGLTRDRTRASAVGGRRLTAWVMARLKPRLTCEGTWSRSRNLNPVIAEFETSRISTKWSWRLRSLGICPHLLKETKAVTELLSSGESGIAGSAKHVNHNVPLFVKFCRY
jgi:hypothetical protein